MFGQIIVFVVDALRDRPFENLGGAGEVQKKKLRKGKLNEKKNSCTPINPKNIHAIA